MVLKLEDESAYWAAELSVDVVNSFGREHDALLIYVLARRSCFAISKFNSRSHNARTLMCAGC